MLLSGKQARFGDRRDAGRQLAEKLISYKNQPVLVLAIPNGGVPVALEVAGALEADFNLIISRKIPVPLNPEAGIGAVSDDGTVILNEEVVKRLGLKEHQIDYQVNQVRADIYQRSLLYLKDRPLYGVAGKTVIIIDDGLASGYTMLAATESVRHRHPKELVVAVPVASASAVKEVKKSADKVVTCATSFAPEFFVSDFYRYWYDVSNGEVVKYLNKWGTRHLRLNKPTSSSPDI